jgi:dienelactone hydrolase
MKTNYFAVSLLTSVLVFSAFQAPAQSDSEPKPKFKMAMASADKMQIKTQVIEYKDGDQVLEGYLAYNAAQKGKRPGVMVVHDWIGMNPNVKHRTEQLAAMGYVAFAADIYGKGVHPKPPQEAGQMAGKYKNDRALFRSRLKAGYQVLLNQAQTDPAQTAAIGYCFGGTGVLELGRTGANLKGIVSFHGGLDSPTPADGKNIKAKVLILHGAADPFVPAKDIEAFTAELNNAKVDWQMISYSGAVHAFTIKEAGNDPSKGAAYNASADMRSWGAMKQFFGEIFK